MTDMDHWHVADQWNLAEDGFGDCEDYQLLKRHLLAEARTALIVAANADDPPSATSSRSTDVITTC